MFCNSLENMGLIIKKERKKNFSETFMNTYNSLQNFKLVEKRVPGGTSILGGGGLAPKFASEIRVRAPNFASKNIGNKCLKFCLLNFRYDLKIRYKIFFPGILSQFLPLVVPELPKFFSLLDI